MSSEKREASKKLRASMTEYDWALEQVCTQLEVYGDESRPGVTVEEMVKQGKCNWDSWAGRDTTNPPVETDGQLYYQYHNMPELMADLLKRGFIELVVNNTP
jgi:hypothetical protein